MKLKVHGIRLEASHAAYEWEQKLGTVIDVEVDLTYRKDPKSDNSFRVVPVEEVGGVVFRISDKKRYKWIEALAGDIVDSIWKKYRARLSGLVVCVKKIRPKSDRRIAGYEVEVSRG